MYVYKEYQTSQQMTDELNGAVIGGPLEARTYGLHGLTLIINDSSADRTVTFSDANNDGLTPKQIIDQIQAAHANLTNVVLRTYQNDPKRPQLVLAKPTYIVKAGTANALVGWPVGPVTITAVNKANIVFVNSAYDVPRFDVLIDV